MIQNLKRLFEIPGERMELDAKLDLSGAVYANGHPFVEPVHIQGEVENRTGIVTLGYLATFTLTTQCSRCLVPVSYPGCYHFKHILVDKSYSDNDSLLVVEDGMLDFTELVTSDVLLELPIRMLCREDCKGLCPKCGTNLNESSCGCDTRQIDPRLMALKELLDETE